MVAPPPSPRGERSGSLVAQELQREKSAAGSEDIGATVSQRARRNSISGMGFSAEAIAQLRAMGNSSLTVGVPKDMADDVVAAQGSIPEGTKTLQRTRSSSFSGTGARSPWHTIFSSKPKGEKTIVAS
jgi:hypothetical protein